MSLKDFKTRTQLNIEELIKELEKYPKDALVFIKDFDEWYDELRSVSYEKKSNKLILEYREYIK